MKSEFLAAEPSYPDHSEAARTLAARASQGVLATLEDDGQPYASIVEVMADDDGAIVLFLSDLAAHTKNLKGDARASIVVADRADDEGVLARSRATFQGAIERVEEGRERYGDAWVEQHPGAANYLGFRDFGFYRMEVERVRFIAGFGRMGWVTQGSYAKAEPDPIWRVSDGIVSHMNDDHGHNLLDYLHAYTGADWADEAQMVSLDRLGFDVVGRADDRVETFRLTFARPRTTSDELHEVMVRLAREARQLLGK